MNLDLVDRKLDALEKKLDKITAQVTEIIAQRDAALKLLWRVYLAWNSGAALKLSHAELQIIGKAERKARKP